MPAESCSACSAIAHHATARHRCRWRETIDEHVGMVDAAAVYGYSFGHITHQYTLPVGALATVNPQAATVTVLEAATSRD